MEEATIHGLVRVSVAVFAAGALATLFYIWCIRKRAPPQVAFTSQQQAKTEINSQAESSSSSEGEETEDGFTLVRGGVHVIDGDEDDGDGSKMDWEQFMRTDPDEIIAKKKKD